MINVKRWEEADHWVEVDLDRCTEVEACSAVYPVGVYEVVGGKVSAENVSECIKCGAGQGVCPHNVIVHHWAYS